jgi:hypothetical protein
MALVHFQGLAGEKGAGVQVLLKALAKGMKQGHITDQKSGLEHRGLNGDIASRLVNALV